MPLIYCPPSYAFADIINDLVRNHSKQAAQLEESAKIHESFMDLAVNDRPIHEILQTLSTLIREPTAYIDTIFHHCLFF